MLTPLTGLEVVAPPVELHDGTFLYKMGLNINLQSTTIDQVLASRRKHCISLGDSMRAELKKSRSGKGVCAHVMDLLQCHEEVINASPFMWFNEDDVYKFVLNTTIDLKLVLEKIDSAIEAFEHSFAEQGIY